jgi:hypothetical protein
MGRRSSCAEEKAPREIVSEGRMSEENPHAPASCRNCLCRGVPAGANAYADAFDPENTPAAFHHSYRPEYAGQ